LNDHPGEDLAFVEDLERFFVEALLEGELVFFLGVRGSDFSRRDVVVPTLYFIFLRTSPLTVHAPPGSALAQHRSYDRFAAPDARFAEPSVDREGILKAAPEAVGIHVVVDARTALVDRASQNVHNGVV